MRCDRVRYYGFRNIADAEIEFDSGTNILYGDNAEGKTNALEGIYMMAQGRSFRPAHENDMIRFGSEAAAIRLTYTAAGRKNELEMKLYRGGKRICKKNGVPLSRLSELMGSFRAVIFCPEHLSLVKEGPAQRRNFLNMAISQLDPEYLSALQRYGRILEQRNALLKKYAFDQKSGEETLTLWTEKLAAEGAVISSRRASYVQKLNEEAAAVFSSMTEGREVPRYVYKEERSAEEYMAAFERVRDRELKTASTLIGPHRDDISILLNDREARLYASQGQQRSLALAMKLAEGGISREVTGEYPVFLLDDIMSELDAGRRLYIEKGLAGRQVILTSCRHDGPADRIFAVRQGTYERMVF